MSIIRYQTPVFTTATFSPLARLSAFHQQVDRLLDSPFFSGENSRSPAGMPALDLYQDADNFTVKAEIPGLKKEDIKLSLQDGVLTLSGERRSEKAHDEKGSLRNERSFGRFERSITLPMQVDGTRVAASYEDGVLTVTLPKAEAAKPRQIEIQAH
jgi:HSP20 family protein